MQKCQVAYWEVSTRQYHISALSSSAILAVWAGTVADVTQHSCRLADAIRLASHGILLQ